MKAEVNICVIISCLNNEETLVLEDLPLETNAWFESTSIKLERAPFNFGTHCSCSVSKIGNIDDLNWIIGSGPVHTHT